MSAKPPEIPTDWTGERHLTEREVMALARIGSRTTMAKLEATGRLIPIRRGSSKRYRASEVEAFLRCEVA